MPYEETANELGKRILRLIPANPQILTMDTFGLHGVAGFKCDDLEPSLAQAGAAKRWAVLKFISMDPAMLDCLTQWQAGENSDDADEVVVARMERDRILGEYADATS